MATAGSSTAELVEAGVRLHTLVDFATSWAAQRSRMAWFLGAGASASAGIPLAGLIRDRLLFDRYASEHGLVRQDLDLTDPHQLARVHGYYDSKNGMPAIGSDGDYSAAFELCLPDPDARKALLREQFEHIAPAYAQRVFGGLIVAGACDLAITTNFDRLIERGHDDAQRAGTDLSKPLSRELNVAGLDSTARATFALQERQWPLVVKLHGDFREQRLMNTDPELRGQDEAMRQFIVDVSRSFGLVVAGYSGRDQSVMEMLNETAGVADAWPRGVWWIVRPGEEIPEPVSLFLSNAAASGVSTAVVVAASFEETMSALARQVVVDEPMRDYFTRLHPKPRVVPAAVSAVGRRKWPVLRFNAVPILDASVRVTRVEIPTGWTRGTVRGAMWPRAAWPVVVNGPGEMLCLGDPNDALSLLANAATKLSLPAPTVAAPVELDPIAEEAPAHHRTLLLQLIGQALRQQLPVRTLTAKDGSPQLVVTHGREDESARFASKRDQLRDAYDSPLSGRLPRSFGQDRRDRNRSWAEQIELSFDTRAGTSWMLFTPYTWVTPLQKDPLVAEVPIGSENETDQAVSWAAEQWAKRRFNEKWAAIISGWTAVICPDPVTTLTVPTPAPTGGPAAVIRLGRTNAFGRPA